MDRSCHGDTLGLSGSYSGVRTDLLEKEYFSSKPIGSRSSDKRKWRGLHNGRWTQKALEKWSRCREGGMVSEESPKHGDAPGDLRPGRARTLWSGGCRAMGPRWPGQYLGVRWAAAVPWVPGRRGAKAGVSGAAEPGGGWAGLPGLGPQSGEAGQRKPGWPPHPLWGEGTPTVKVGTKKSSENRDHWEASSEASGWAPYPCLSSSGDLSLQCHQGQKASGARARGATCCYTHQGACRG